MSAVRNRRWVLAARPQGVPRPTDFQIVESAARAPAAGELCVRVQYLSMDPAPRMRMDEVPRMGPPLPLGETVIGRGAGIVEASAAAGFAVGDCVAGELGWQEHAVVPAAAVRKVDCTLAPMSAYLGLLAASGLTAWFALSECARARAGETVLVSAAAGSVGLAACQIARLLKCRVIAVAHGAEQARFIERELAPDAVVDDTSPALATALDAACQPPVDVFLDSVGGVLHEAVMDRIAVGARAVLYGFISAYNQSAGTEPEYGRIYQVIRKRAHLMGFLIADHAERTPQALEQLSAWLRKGRLHGFECVREGFESVPAAFAELFGEAAPGKHLVRLA